MSDVPTRSNLHIEVTRLSWQAEAVSDVPDEHTAGVALEPAIEQPDQLHPLFLSGPVIGHFLFNLISVPLMVLVVMVVFTLFTLFNLFSVVPESLCLNAGAGGDGGLHPGPRCLLTLLSPLCQICKGETLLFEWKILSINTFTQRVL